MTSAASLLSLLVLAVLPAAWADIAPMPGSLEWEYDKREEAKQCEPGEELLECVWPRPFRQGKDVKSPFSCDRLDADPDTYHLSSLKRRSRYCRSAPDLPQACLGKDAEVACDTGWCPLSAKPKLAKKCDSGLPPCDELLHSPKHYRIRKKSSERLFYCRTDAKTAAHMSLRSDGWGKALAECARLNFKSAPEARGCSGGETEHYCLDTSWPDAAGSCAAFRGDRRYYEVPRASGSTVPGSKTQRLFCGLPPDEAAKREAGYRGCLDEALKKLKNGP